MLFWTIAAGMTVGALLLLLLPLLRNRNGAAGDRAAYDLEVYRDQLDELERDVSRNLITPAQADAARAEIGRRMLSAAGKTGTAPEQPALKKAETAGSRNLTRLLAALMIIGVPVGSLALYGSVGRPDAPAQPLASRNLDAERGGPPADVLAAVEKLRNALENDPSDPQGWTILGQAYARMGRLEDSVKALRKAAELAPENVEILGAYGEVLVSANGGTVPALAVETFDRILTLQPREPRARFFAGLARQQAGDRQGAMERWRSLMAESPADAPWVPVVRSHLTQLAQDLKLDPAQVIPAPLPATTDRQTDQGQSDQDQTGGNQAPAEQSGTDQMVRGMVNQLIAKLEANPDDVRGWMMLARSHGVLGEPEKAVAAATKALELAPQQADVQIAYATAHLIGTDSEAPLPDIAVGALNKALEIDPNSTDALWLLGLDAANRKNAVLASSLWTRLIDQFKPESPEYAVLRERIDGLKRGS